MIHNIQAKYQLTLNIYFLHWHRWKWEDYQSKLSFRRGRDWEKKKEWWRTEQVLTD